MKMFEIFAATENKTFTPGISYGRMEFSRLILEKKTEKSGMLHIIHYFTFNLGAEVSKENYTWKGKSFSKFHNQRKTERKNGKKKWKEKTERKTEKSYSLFLHPVLFYCE